MTNRVQYQDQIQEQTGKEADLQVIREILEERKEPLTLENARLVLFVGLRNKPTAWSITLTELAELWPPAEQA